MHMNRLWIPVCFPPRLFPQALGPPSSPSLCGTRYIYGKPVRGVAYVRFALLDEDGEKTFLRGLETQTKVGRRWGR
jgi:hypothetical protein